MYSDLRFGERAILFAQRGRCFSQVMLFITGPAVDMLLNVLFHLYLTVRLDGLKDQTRWKKRLSRDTEHAVAWAMGDLVQLADVFRLMEAASYVK